jgi:hypothetical protein
VHRSFRGTANGEAVAFPASENNSASVSGVRGGLNANAKLLLGIHALTVYTPGRFTAGAIFIGAPPTGTTYAAPTSRVVGSNPARVSLASVTRDIHSV